MAEAAEERPERQAIDAAEFELLTLGPTIA
jgi:hypothetical protein